MKKNLLIICAVLMVIEGALIGVGFIRAKIDTTSTETEAVAPPSLSDLVDSVADETPAEEETEEIPAVADALYADELLAKTEEIPAVGLLLGPLTVASADETQTPATIPKEQASASA